MLSYFRIRSSVDLVEENVAVSSIPSVSVHAGQGALRSEDQNIPCFPFAIVPTCALGIELRNSRTVFSLVLLLDRIPLGAPSFKPQRSTRYQITAQPWWKQNIIHGRRKRAAISHSKPHYYTSLWFFLIFFTCRLCVSSFGWCIL